MLTDTARFFRAVRDAARAAVAKVFVQGVTDLLREQTFSAEDEQAEQCKSSLCETMAAAARKQRKFANVSMDSFCTALPGPSCPTSCALHSRS